MEIYNKDYKEVKIKKMVVDGKEQEGNIIYAEDTKNKQELHVTIFTQDSDAQDSGVQNSDTQESDTQESDTQENDTQESVVQESGAQESVSQESGAEGADEQKIDEDIHTAQKKGRGLKLIYELLQKIIFHNRRS